MPISLNMHLLHKDVNHSNSGNATHGRLAYWLLLVMCYCMTRVSNFQDATTVCMSVSASSEIQILYKSVSRLRDATTTCMSVSVI